MTAMYVVDATSSGITPAAYATGDQVGAVISWDLTNIVQPGARFGIRQVVVIDASDTLAAFDLAFYDQTVTVATDNDAASTSDAQELFCQGVVSFVAANIVDIGPNKVATMIPGNGGYHCVSIAGGGDNKLYGIHIAQAAVTPVAATDFRYRLYIEI